MKKLRLVCMAALFASCLVRVAPAADHRADETAIRDTAKAFEKAFDAGDAKAIAAQFAADGEFIDEDETLFTGREAIEKEFADFFADVKGTKIKLDINSIRFVGNDLAFEEGSYTSAPPKDGPISQMDYLTVHKKQEGKWLVASSRSVGERKLAPHERLKQVAWLVGDWIDESPDVDVHHQVKWSEDGNFLLANFTVQRENKRLMKGEQRIGWDPLTKQIKSWVFDSQGGHAEGLWSEVNGGWEVKMTGVRADGAAASSTNTYAPDGPDKFVWNSVDRLIGGEQEPNVSVIIVRKPPQPNQK